MIVAQPVAEHYRGAMLRGDRIYAALRWLLLSALGAYGAASGSMMLWPPASWNLATLALWGFAFWTVIASMLLFSPALGAMRPWLYLGDVVGFAILAYLSVERASTYEALMFVPLIAAGLRLRRRDLVPVSALSALVGLAIHLNQPDRDLASGIARLITFATVPWLVHLLSEQWSQDNRRFVQTAEQQAQTALQHAEEYRGRMRALYEAAVTLGATANAPSVLDAMLNECAKLVPYRACAILLPTDVRDELGIVAARNLAPLELQTKILVGSGTLSTLLRGGNGGVLPDANKAELSSLPSLTACRTVLLLPLRAARRTYGLLALGSDLEQLTAEHMEMVTTLAGYSVVALQNARLSGDLREERMLVLQREADMRRKLNRDLHDGPAQSLAAITMNLEFVKRLMEHEPERVLPELNKVIRLAQRSNHDVRTLLFELRPMTLEAQGLVPTLQRYFERFTDGPTKVLIESDDLEPLDLHVQSILFNVTQEAVNNAIKHAEATTIRVVLRRANDQVTLRIEDDGKGFDLSQVRDNYEERGSFGLLNIEERAKLANGLAEIHSVPGQGTQIEVCIPLE